MRFFGPDTLRRRPPHGWVPIGRPAPRRHQTAPQRPPCPPRWPRRRRSPEERGSGRRSGPRPRGRTCRRSARGEPVRFAAWAAGLAACALIFPGFVWAIAVPKRQDALTGFCGGCVAFLRFPLWLKCPQTNFASRILASWDLSPNFFFLETIGGEKKATKFYLPPPGGTK